MVVDVLVDLQFGDSGKGKISKALDESINYDAICKVQGGSNAGHAVWIGDDKYTAHHLTSAIYSDADVFIGPGCVLNPSKFLQEIDEFNEKFNVKTRTFIHPSTHIVTADHIREEESESIIGTTRQGIGPAYSDKYRRTGIRAKSVSELSRFIAPDIPFVDMGYEKVLMEGSQGFWLDIDHGNYPYVTSSHIHPAFAFTSFGISMKHLGRVFGVAKVYETYVGTSNYIVNSDAEFEKLAQEYGQEYGETTGRLRKVGYLNIDKLVDSCKMCGVDEIFLNKADILEKIGKYPFIRKGLVHLSDNMDDFKSKVTHILNKEEKLDINITFSGNKHGI